MVFTKLIPNIFYTDISVGLDLFVDCLGFTIGHNDLDGENAFYVIEKDALRAHLIQSREFAEKDRPELRLETTNIEEAYQQIKNTHPRLLHPNLKKIKLQPWKASEFALLDASGVCVIIFEWQR